MQGSDVRRFQELLADRGHFPPDKINGVFGPLTKESLIAYQIETGIVDEDDDQGAGTLGPTTLRLLRQDEVARAYRVVRGGGWRAL